MRDIHLRDLASDIQMPSVAECQGMYASIESVYAHMFLEMSCNRQYPKTEGLQSLQSTRGRKYEIIVAGSPEPIMKTDFTKNPSLIAKKLHALLRRVSKTSTQLCSDACRLRLPSQIGLIKALRAQVILKESKFCRSSSTQIQEDLSVGPKS